MTVEAGSDRVIVALDGMDLKEAELFVRSIPELLWVKVGLELFVSAGPEVVLRLKDLGKRIFLDLKFHDIPATMAAACRQAARLGADLMTVHASAGQAALGEARHAVAEGAAEAGLDMPRLLGVTVLTSWRQEPFKNDLRVAGPIQSYVCHLADLVAAAGLPGCVCSPQEVSLLRSRHPEPFALVTPGIRPAGSQSDDQARVMTPPEALQAGASQLVIGRPITRAGDPRQAFAACCRSLNGR